MAHIIDDLVCIMEKLDFKIVTLHEFPQVVEMSAYEAFIFSAITGATYLITDTGITMKGRNEVFIHRSVFQHNKYIYSPGLFSRDINENYVEDNSADILKDKYPSIFMGKKYILFQDVSKRQSSNIEKSIFKYLTENGLQNEHILLYKVFESGSSFEPFLEYMTVKHFLKQGYLVENQVPWFQQKFAYNGKMLNGGIPDFSAFHSSISTYLYQYGIINKNSGIILNMLPLIKCFEEFDIKKTKNTRDFQYELIIGEAKADKNSLDQALKQLEQYQSVGLATELYSIIPNLNNNSSQFFGEIFINNFVLEINKSKLKPYTDSHLQMLDSIWIDNYIKALLLGNLCKVDIDDLIHTHRKINGLPLLSSYKSYHLIDMIIEVSVETILNKIRKN